MELNQEFINKLASKAPTPGGGGASAYCGALASALSSMVGNLTLGKKAYEQVQDGVKEALAQLEDQRFRLLALVDEDAQVFKPLSRAYTMPKSTPEEAEKKEVALQKALIGATEVPLQIMKVCAQVIATSEFLAYNGSRLALSDAGVAVLFAEAALKGASFSVFANTALISDADRAQGYCKEATDLIKEYSALAEKIYEHVLKETRK